MRNGPSMTDSLVDALTPTACALDAHQRLGTALKGQKYQPLFGKQSSAPKPKTSRKLRAPRIRTMAQWLSLKPTNRVARMIALLRERGGLTGPELAALMGIKVSNVSASLEHARRAGVVTRTSERLAKWEMAK